MLVIKTSCTSRTMSSQMTHVATVETDAAACPPAAHYDIHSTLLTSHSYVCTPILVKLQLPVRSHCFRQSRPAPFVVAHTGHTLGNSKDQQHTCTCGAPITVAVRVTVMMMRAEKSSRRCKYTPKTCLQISSESMQYRSARRLPDSAQPLPLSRCAA